MNQTNPIRTFRLGALSPLLDNRAKHEKVKASVVMRRALREYIGKGSPAASSDTALLVSALERTRLELSRIGGNLNQLAHAFNIDERMLKVDDLKRAHDELREQFRALTVQLCEIQNERRSE